MAIPKRHGSPPGTYFVTSKTCNSQSLFQVEMLAQSFTESLMEYRAQGRFLLHAFVLMPDHFHLLITPSDTTSLERAVQLIKGGSAHKIGLERKSKFPVWQRGFSDHRIRDAADYVKHVEYIELNPVKRGLTAAPRDYRWSSAGGQYPVDEPPQGLKPLEVHNTIASVGTTEVVP